MWLTIQTFVNERKPANDKKNNVQQGISALCLYSEPKLVSKWDTETAAMKRLKK